MAEQLTLDAAAAVVAELPPAFLAHWRKLERHCGTPPATLAAGFVMRSFGRLWLEVRVNGRGFALLNRTDETEAAEELWRQLGRRVP